MSTEDVTITSNRLQFSGGEVLSLDLPVSEMLRFGDVAVVRLRVPADVIYNENVFGISVPERKILWQVPLQRHVYDHSPYLSIARSNDRVALSNRDGTRLVLDPATGAILGEEWHK